MNHRQLFSFSNTCWIKIEVLHLRDRWCSIAPENVILFIGVIGVAPENVTSITFSESITFSVVTYHNHSKLSLNVTKYLDRIKSLSLSKNYCIKRKFIIKAYLPC